MLRNSMRSIIRDLTGALAWVFPWPKQPPKLLILVTSVLKIPVFLRFLSLLWSEFLLGCHCTIVRWTPPLFLPVGSWFFLSSVGIMSAFITLSQRKCLIQCLAISKHSLNLALSNQIKDASWEADQLKDYVGSPLSSSGISFQAT